MLELVPDFFAGFPELAEDPLLGHPLEAAVLLARGMDPPEEDTEARRIPLAALHSPDLLHGAIHGFVSGNVIPDLERGA